MSIKGGCKLTLDCDYCGKGLVCFGTDAEAAVGVAERSGWKVSGDFPDPRHTVVWRPKCWAKTGTPPDTRQFVLVCVKTVDGQPLTDEQARELCRAVNETYVGPPKGEVEIVTNPPGEQP